MERLKRVFAGILVWAMILNLCSPMANVRAISPVDSGALTVHSNTNQTWIWVKAEATERPTVNESLTRVNGSGSLTLEGEEAGYIFHENGLFILIFEGHSIEQGDLVKVKGQFEASDGFIIDMEETTFVCVDPQGVEGTYWEIKEDVTEVSSGTVTLGQVKATRIWFNTETRSESITWTSMSAIADNGSITLNENQEPAARLFHETYSGGYLIEMDELTFTAGDVVTIKGKFQSADGRFVIDMAETSFICVDPTGVGGAYWKLATSADLADYQKVTVNEVVAPSGYNSVDQRYDFYLDLNETVGDSQSLIDGMQYSINDGEKKPLTALMTPHTGETLLAILWLEEATEPMKVTFSGKGVLSENPSKGLEFNNEVTVYINQYGWSSEGFIQPTNYVDTKISGLYTNDSKYFNEEQGWHFYLGLSVKNADIAANAALQGFQYSINGGAKKELTAFYADYDGGSLFFIMPELGKNITSNTKITISGQAQTADGKQGLKLTEEVTLYGNESGWSLEDFVIPTSYTDTSINQLFKNDSKYFNEEQGWHFYLGLSVKNANIAENAALKGFQYSINGGAKKELTAFYADYDGGSLFFIMPELGKNITTNTKITISGQAQTTDGKQGLKLTEEVTLYGNATGWSLSGFLKPTQYSIVTGKQLDGATKWNVHQGDARWEFYLQLSGDTSKIPDDALLSGFQYSINGSQVKQPLGECFWSPHAGGTLLFVIRDIEAKKLTQNIQITISGKGKTIDGVYGLELKQEVTLYGNQYGWSTDGYPKEPVYTKINVTGVNGATSYIANAKRWDIYLTVDKMLPGADDSAFRTLSVEINGKTYDMVVYHAGHEDTLFLSIEDDKLSKDVPNGTKIVLKAGQAMQEGKGIGVELLQDVTLYKFYDSFTIKKPTTDTKYTEITVGQLEHATKYREDSQMWPIFLKIDQEIPGENGTRFYELKAILNGKEVLLNATKEGKVLFVSIPAQLLSGNAKTGTLSFKAGSKAVGGAGEVGIHIIEDFNIYLFNGVWSEDEFEEIIETELFCTRLHNCTHNGKSTLWGFYLKTNAEFPGRPWYNKFDKFQVELNGKKVTVELNKSDGTGGRVIYFGLDEKVVGKFKDGSILKIKANSVAEDGAYKITFTKDFSLIYTNGMWVEYRQTDKVAPEAQNLWDVARFDSTYIPQSEDGTVYVSGYDDYTSITSTEKLMDQTIKFTGKKFYDDVVGYPFHLVLRGNPISETEPISRSLLYGYVITFEGYEITEENTPNSPELWGTRSGFINVWKNGENAALSDQYLIGTHHAVTNDPYFKFDETYEYEVSIYNITETSVCIEFSVNGELAYKCYDDATTDPMDPAVNPGTFGIYVGVPTYIGGETVELETVLAEAKECTVGEKVGVAATYPSVLKDAEFSVDKKGATVEEGYFVAEKAGTYTISATYKGKELKPVTITVSEKAVDDTVAQSDGNMTAIIIIIVTTVVLAAGIGTVLVIKKRKERNCA